MAAETVDAPVRYGGPRNVIERLICRWLFRLMIQDGKIAVDYGLGAAGDTAEFVIACPTLWAAIKIVLAPNLNVGETFVAGDWFLRRGKLSDFIALIKANPPRFYGAYYRCVSQFRGFRFYVEQFFLRRYFTRQVRSHYELDPVIYEFILDPELVYTCAFFDTPEDTLADAQQRKIATVISRMRLPEGPSHVLDIGCGWGATERALVRTYPEANVCGLTISRAQVEWASVRDQEHLSDGERARIEYRVEDFAAHKRRGHYDSICVVGLIEHVGLGGYGEFFRFIHDALKPGGTAVVHTIVAPVSEFPSNRWMDKHIFIGGYAPSVSELTHAIEQVPLALTGAYLHAPSEYRRTIEHWLENLQANRLRLIDHALARAGDREAAERTFRMWDFYLSAVRNMFDPSESQTYQIAHICVSKRP
jgi:cyclopropane-fatty-acyl-phospholipid synthase